MPFAEKKKFSEMVWNFIGVNYVINRTLHGRLEIQNFSSCVEKCISALEEKFCISSGHVISSIFKLIVITVNNDNENDNDND